MEIVETLKVTLQFIFKEKSVFSLDCAILCIWSLYRLDGERLKNSMLFEIHKYMYIIDAIGMMANSIKFDSCIVSVGSVF